MIKKDKALREHLKQVRFAVGSVKRARANDVLFAYLYPLLAPYKCILSYSTKGSEVDVTDLNRKLCDEKRLLLPRLEGEQLVACQVDSFDTALQLGRKFRLLQPKEDCHRVAYSDIDCILVPALGFDEHRHRIGYGFGFYDRLIEKVDALTIGIAFTEQQLKGVINKDPHDRAVDQVLYI